MAVRMEGREGGREGKWQPERENSTPDKICKVSAVISRCQQIKKKSKPGSNKSFRTWQRPKRQVLLLQAALPNSRATPLFHHHKSNRLHENHQKIGNMGEKGICGVTKSKLVDAYSIYLANLRAKNGPM